jgi:transcriptional regulator with XRE-family HTH domain
MSTPASAVSSQPSRRGRHASLPSIPLGMFIQTRLDGSNKTRTELARRLHVSPSTVGRLLNGDTRVVQRISAESICDALELDEMDRRDFMKLVGSASASTFAFATGAAASKTSKSAIDLDLANDHADALSRLINQGDVRYVMESAQRWYDQLLQNPPSRDQYYAATQIRFGILLGASQEFVFPWYQRSQTAIQTYNSIEREVILRFGLNTFRHEYANLLSHRAPLYREIGQYEESSLQFQDGIYWVKTIDDPLLRANLFRSRIHVNAVQGSILQWSRQLEEARKDALIIGSAHRDEVAGLLDYVEGEGYKRFAYNVRQDLPDQVRREYAERALQSFEQSKHGTEHYVKAHTMLRMVSEAQCLLWIDIHEAIRHVELLRAEAELEYPALVEKINRVVFFAQQLLRSRKSNLPLHFNLDARYK